MIIACDYDGTLEINGVINRPLVAQLRSLQAQGNAVILWSCRTGKRLQDAVNACAKAGLRFNAVNQNIPDIIARQGDGRKIYADIYIDDKAMRP